MKEQDKLRFEVKMLKATGAIKTYKELVSLLNSLTYKSFCEWLRGSYSLGYEKERQLQDIVNTLYVPQ